MKVTFLGTGSHAPTIHRSTSCIALEQNGGSVWLFDCGEGSRAQLLKSQINPQEINKIFITHMHGDHLFGLPGMLLYLNIRPRDSVLEIYGPVGLRGYIQSTLDLGRQHLKYRFKIIELECCKNQIPEEWKRDSHWPLPLAKPIRKLPNEEEGRVVECDENGVWSLIREEWCSVSASWLLHRVPSWGYVINGKKKVVVLGDTCDSSAILNLAHGADFLVHESTHIDSRRELALRGFHSTPRMAVEFSKLISCKSLVLTHFSRRYSPFGFNEESLEKMLDDAKKAMGSFPCKLFLAQDFSSFEIL